MVAVSSRARSSRAVAVWRVPRSRGAMTGVLLVLLGLWGGLVPFLGPRFGFAYTPNAVWTMTWGRLWIEVVPSAAALLGGIFLIFSASRVAGLWAGWLAALAGAWLVVGPAASKLWFHGVAQTGSPVPGTSVTRAVAEEIGLFSGTGVLIVFLAAVAIGRFSVIGVRETEAAVAEQEAAAAESDYEPYEHGREAPTEAFTPAGNEPSGQHALPEERPVDPKVAQERMARIRAENAAANRHDEGRPAESGAYGEQR